jgi:NarL family two-component system sensor histidine kinase YdfH
MAFNPSRATRVFFYFVYTVLVIIWYATMATPTWKEPRILIPYTVTMLVHGVLHSRADRISETRWTAAYLVLQTGIVLVLLLLADGSHYTAALFAAVAGEAVGMLRRWSSRISALAFIAAVWALGVGLTGGLEGMLDQLPWMAAAVAFATFYVVLFLRQLEERTRAEALLAQLETAHAQLREYAHQVEELSITEERHRMARELHDTLAQGLAGLIMQLEAVDDLLSRGDSEQARAIVTRAMERTRQTLAEARQTIHQLRQPLERGDLVEAIQRELDRAKQEGGLEVRFDLSPGGAEVEEQVAQHLHRIVQEGITNVIRHARARTVTVSLWAKGDLVHLSIADDGVGFDPAAGTREGHFGLIGVGERVRLLGGTFRLDSQPGRGTRLIVAVPKRMKRKEGAS